VKGGKSRSEFRPKAKAITQRLVGTLRRGCLDHVIVVNESHLVRLLWVFAAYYNVDRPHRTSSRGLESLIGRF
jgi:hypothetical protein